MIMGKERQTKASGILYRGSTLMVQVFGQTGLDKK